MQLVVGGVHTLPGDPAGEQHERALALGLLPKVHALVAGAGVKVTVCAHVDQVFAAAPGAAPNGPILRIASWAPPASLGGTWATAAAAPELTAVQGDARYLRIV